MVGYYQIGQETWWCININRSVLLNQGQFCPTSSLPHRIFNNETFWLLQLGGMHTGFWGSKARDAATYLTMHRTAPTTKDYPTQNVSRIEIKKLVQIMIPSILVVGMGVVEKGEQILFYITGQAVHINFATYFMFGFFSSHVKCISIFMISQAFLCGVYYVHFKALIHTTYLYI